MDPCKNYKEVFSKTIIVINLVCMNKRPNSGHNCAAGSSMHSIMMG